MSTESLSIADYSDKSFVVFGPSSKAYSQQLKNTFRGKYNGKLGERPGFPGGPAWIFMTKMRPDLEKFVTDVNEGKIANPSMLPEQGEMALPNVPVPVKNSAFQTVRWTVFRPAMGMTVTVKAGSAVASGEILAIENNKTIVDTVYVSINGNTSKLVICNGKWTVWGYMVDHSVYFNNNEEVPQETEQGCTEMANI